MGLSWFYSAVRIAGSAFPVTSALVQLQAEVDAAEFERRLVALEDPIGQMHPKISELCELIYSQLSGANGTAPRIELEAGQYTKYRKPLAVIEASRFIEGTHALNHQFVQGFHVVDPTFVLYLQARFGASEPMKEIEKKLESTVSGDRLSGHALSQELGVPLAVAHAMFQVYESKGYGMCSRERGASSYIARA